MTKNTRVNPLVQFDDVNRLLEGFFSGDILREQGTSTKWTPRADLIELDEAYSVILDIPGLSKSDVDISFKDEFLTVSGKRERAEKSEETTYFRHERNMGEFSRRFGFRKAIDVEGIKATFKNGVLTISIPKAADSKPRTIKIS